MDCVSRVMTTHVKTVALLQEQREYWMSIMAKNKTDKCYLQSIFGGGYITEGQFLAERMCLQHAKIHDVYIKPKFWESQKYAAMFKRQVTSAYKLLKKYPFVVIWDTLNDRRCRKVETLGGMFILQPILDEKLALYKRQQEKIQYTEKTSTDEKPRKPLGKRSILSQLD